MTRFQNRRPAHDDRLGANYGGGDRPRGPCDFKLWAPHAGAVTLQLLSPEERELTMEAGAGGYFSIAASDVAADSLYRFALFPRSSGEGKSRPLIRPDPASRLQPKGVHGPSRIVADTFPWTDARWENPPLHEHIFYELHVGAATAQGTFDALVLLLPAFGDLGITALELMPVGEFPGRRNWGYDGVYPFAVHHAYGGPLGLKRLVDACHRQGLAVIMDVVYNHLGPEGNYLADFGPYFTDRYTTPWGRAVNFDGPYSDAVRRYFLENARYWIRDCHIDGLRVDAVHGIYDFSARPFLAALTKSVHAEARRLGRRIHCIAESDLNDPAVIRRREAGGMGFDAQWNDDFHHALHGLVTGEKDGYYADFGRLDDLARAWRRGFVFDGRYSTFRRRCHGNNAGKLPTQRFVVYCQNHDQVGNRMKGERLTALAGFEQHKLAAACVFFSPYIPLLFMGEEYAEPAPFAYFISHGDAALVRAVRQGRRAEFRAFAWKGVPPDPQDPATFKRCVLNRDLADMPGSHRVMSAFYRELIRLRKTLPALSPLAHRGRVAAGRGAGGVMRVVRRHRAGPVCILFNFNACPAAHVLRGLSGRWRKQFDSSEARWMGQGSRAPTVFSICDGAAVSLAPWQVVLWQGDDGGKGNGGAEKKNEGGRT